MAFCITVTREHHQTVLRTVSLLLVLLILIAQMTLLEQFLPALHLTVNITSTLVHSHNVTEYYYHYFITIKQWSVVNK